MHNSAPPGGRVCAGGRPPAVAQGQALCCHTLWPNIVPPAPEDPPEPDPAPVEKIVSLAVRVNGEPVEVVHQPDPAPDE